MSELQQLLHLRAAPVAIAFLPSAPDGVAHVASREPAGCGYWRRAAAGEVFYTDADDHKRCPVGAHTHGVKLNAAEAKELEGLVETMVGLEYLSMDEVPSIPTRTGAVRRRGLLADRSRAAAARRRAGARHAAAADAARRGGASGRRRRGHADDGTADVCAVAGRRSTASAVGASLGCIGNRVYTALDDNEAYFAIPGGAVAAVEEKLRAIVHANQELEKFHRARAQG